LYRHYKERETFYEKRKYPFKILKINLWNLMTLGC
jgi:hypothetical protein